METLRPDGDDGYLRITKEEALSDHVDDLLKRQLSLRGEGGVARSHRRWYFQNWFVFMVAGLLGAVLAWAAIEPIFDDTLYVQGPIETLDATQTLPEQLVEGNRTLDLKVTGQGSVTIHGERIWLLRDTLQLDRQRTRLDVTSLRQGQEIGLYVEYEALGDQALALARFAVLSPAPRQTPTPSLRRLNARSAAGGLLLFPLVAGMIGLFIGAADGIICRVPLRALTAGGIGLLVGFIGGFVMSIIANLVYAPLNTLALAQMGPDLHSMGTFGFVIQTCGRALAWALAGMAMGLGQGLALRSGRLLLYGFLGGLIGGLLGGLLFDPIDLLLLGVDKPGAEWSRFIGLGVIGASVGLLIGIVELLSRDAWLQMTKGPLAGKEFLIFKDTMQIGSSPRAEIYLFGDPGVADIHARLRAVGNDCEIESASGLHPLYVNSAPVLRTRLRHGDQITLGQTTFTFQRRQG